MSLNWKEIDLLLQELPLESGQIQKVLQPTYRTLVFKIHTPRHGTTNLYFDFTQGSTRFHAIAKLPEKEVPTQRFVQFARKHLVNRRIVKASQVGQERIIKLVLSPVEKPTHLYVRLWSNRGNIYVTEPDGTIIDQLFRLEKSSAQKKGEWKYFRPHELVPEHYEEDNRTVRPWKGISFSQFLETYYNESKIEHTFARLHKQLLEQLERKYRRVQKGLAELATDNVFETGANHTTGLHNGTDSWQKDKLFGDLILSNLYQIKRGMKSITLMDYLTHPENPIQRTIPLREHLSPHENAEWYYKQQRTKERRKAHYLAQQEELTKEAKTLEAHMQKCKGLQPSEESLTWLKTALATLGQAENHKNTGNQTHQPGLRFTSQNYTIIVGRGSTENEELLRSHLRGNDYWLHTRDTPGAYVFIKRIGKKSIPLEVLLDAGNLAVHYSKSKTNGKADLYYTQVKYLRKVKGGKKGLVLPTQEKNLYIVVEPERIERLIRTKQ